MKAAGRMRCAAAALLAAAMGVSGRDGPAAEGAASSPPRVETAGSVSAARALAPTRTAALSWAADGCPVPSDNPRAPIGRTSEELARMYGPPAHDDRFILGEAIDLVRMTVRNTLSSPADLRRKVREQLWERAGCELFVWAVERNGRWTAVDSFRTQSGWES